MKKSDLIQVIQVLANIGVLASVIVLALEIRGNTVASRSQEIGSLFEQDQALLATTIEASMSETMRFFSSSPLETPKPSLKTIQLGLRFSIGIFPATRS